MPFSVSRPVRFGDCDPAGIVFYPRYFEMINAVVEDWFAHLGHDFRQIIRHDGNGVPTVTISAEFPAASRMGDVLDFSLRPVRIGGASLELLIEAVCGGELRLTARPVLVWIDGAAMKARPWPDALRRRVVAELDPKHEEG